MNESTSNPGVSNGGSSQSKLIILLLLFLTVAVGFLLAERFARRGKLSPSQAVRPVTPRGDLDDAEKSTIELFQKSSQSVVHVTSLIRQQRSMFERGRTQKRGTGSGFVWDENGHIVTNLHVLVGSNEFLVTFADQTQVEAKVVGLAQHKDLALLKVDVDQDSLRPIAIGESSNLQVGQHVFAIGNPFGLDQTLTTGVISGLGREIKSQTDRTITDVVQTDAAINPGNSGGPLLDSAGRLIGVNTQIVSASGASDGISFAIPVDTLQRVIPQLITHGRVITPSLGIHFLHPQILRQVGVAVKGVLVRDTLPDGPAEDAGVLPFRFDANGQVIFGDVLVGLDDQEIQNADDLYQALESHAVGDRVKLHVVRAANREEPQQLSLDVTLGSLEN